MQTAQEQLAESKRLLLASQNIRHGDKEVFERVEKQLQGQLEELRRQLALVQPGQDTESVASKGETDSYTAERNDMLVREVEHATEGSGMLRERIQRQSHVIEDLGTELKRIKEVRVILHHCAFPDILLGASINQSCQI